MRGNLGVTIRDTYGDRVVTRAVTGLRFRKTAPGGHADASCNISLPRSQFPTLGPADRFYISDTSTADTIWDGYTNNPGAQAGRDGEAFEVTALGGMSLASDQAERLIYLDASYEDWVLDFAFASQPTAISEIDQFPDGTVKAGTPAIFLQFPPGQPIDNGYYASMRYRGFLGTDMHLGAIAGVFYSGTNSAGGTLICRWRSPTVIISDANASTTLASKVLYAGVDFTAASDADEMGFTWRRPTGGATTVAADNVWGAFGEVHVLGHLLDRDGALRTMSTTAHITPGTTVVVTDAYVLAHEVAEDLLGRMLTFCDPATSGIDATATYHIDQLAYRTAVKAAEVLDDLSKLEANYLWEILESDVSTSKHRFNWRAWPTTSRYILPPSIPVEQPGGEADLCNRIAISWVDQNGDQQVTIRTSTVPELGTRIRDAEPVTLPEGQGSDANAIQIGDQILATKAAPPQAGTAVVDRPIIDTLTGSTVQPWEIEPGYLVRVASTGEDLRLTEMEYDDDSCTAKLTIGDPVLTVEQRVARLDRLVK